MQCAGVREELGPYLEGLASESDIVAVEQHLAACVDCRRELEELREAVSLLGLVEEVQPPPDLRLAILEATTRRRSLLGTLRERLLPTPSARWAGLAAAAACAGLVLLSRGQAPGPSAPMGEERVAVETRRSTPPAPRRGDRSEPSLRQVAALPADPNSPAPTRVGSRTSAPTPTAVKDNSAVTTPPALPASRQPVKGPAAHAASPEAGPVKLAPHPVPTAPRRPEAEPDAFLASLPPPSDPEMEARMHAAALAAALGHGSTESAASRTGEDGVDESEDRSDDAGSAETNPKLLKVASLPPSDELQARYVALEASPTQRVLDSLRSRFEQRKGARPVTVPIARVHWD